MVQMLSAEVRIFFMRPRSEIFMSERGPLKQTKFDDNAESGFVYLNFAMFTFRKKVVRACFESSKRCFTFTQSGRRCSFR